MVLLLPNYPMKMNYSRDTNPYSPTWKFHQSQQATPESERQQDEQFEPLPFALAYTTTTTTNLSSETKIHEEKKVSDEQNDDFYIPEEEEDNDDDDGSLSDDWSVDSVADFPEIWEHHVFDNNTQDSEDEEEEHGIVILESQSSTINVQDYFAAHQEIAKNKHQEQQDQQEQNGVQAPLSSSPRRHVTFCESIVTEVNHYPKAQPESLSDMYYSADELQEILEDYILEERQRMRDEAETEINS
mmetsp:Transcript_3648/g.4052  ORF Transcript_3648/g.4052 Transcript_3648/m.4052 type:complete len:243 (-) Transcript_3648:109-837(-)